MEVILYDGACGLCARGVQLVLRRDRAERFRFAALQSDFGREAFRRHGLDAGRLDTWGVLIDAGSPRERLLVRSRASVHVARALGGRYRIAALLLGLVPRRLADWAYDRVAARRYAWFGAAPACRIPTASERARFLDSAAPALGPAGMSASASTSASTFASTLPAPSTPSPAAAPAARAEPAHA